MMGRNEAGSFVNRIGRILAVFALAFQREVDHHDAVLLHNADQQHDSDDCDHAQVLVKEKQCEKAPTPADGNVDRIVMGWIKLSYKTPSTMYT